VAGRNSELASTGEGTSNVFAVMAGIMVHHYTSVYITVTEEELRLGTIVAVHESVILLTITQTTLEYITRHPHPPPSNEL
jgi:hypothetical protein